MASSEPAPAASPARLVSPVGGDDDPALRPRALSDFAGQAKVRRLLSVSISGANAREEALDHVLLYGPPGLGKTTLAQIIAAETGGRFRPMAAPAIQRPGDLATALVSLAENDVLFIDEIHRLAPSVEELLYGPMEDFRLDLLTGDAAGAKPVSVPLPRFTLVGATTRQGMLTRPLRDRFRINGRLEPYAAAELESIVARSAGLLGMRLAPGVAAATAVRSRGTPRIANRLLRHLRDFSADLGESEVSLATADETFGFLEIDDRGLDERDRRYLDCLRIRYHNRPVGLGTIAAAMNEDQGTLEDEVEPWLVAQGYVDRTPRGRTLGPAAHGCLPGMALPQG